MLKSYEAIIENDKVKWMAEHPNIKSARIIVTVLEDYTHRKKKRTPPAALAGKAKILGDIVGPIVDEEDWECLKFSTCAVRF